MKKVIKKIIAGLVILTTWGYDNVYAAGCTSTTVITLPATFVPWNTSRNVGDSYIIPNGCTLQISGATTVIDIINDVRFTVQPGGRLEIIGATLQLDPNCSCMWGGIVVEGDRQQCQIPITNQGYLYTYGATIRDAELAVEARDGAFLNCKYTTFLNNKMDVYMMPYDASPYGCTCANLSHFDFCKFQWDDLVCGATDFDTHVRLDRVYQVHFWSCEFTNYYPVMYSLGMSRGIGLLATDASFQLLQGGVSNPILTQGTGCNGGRLWECGDGGTYNGPPSLFYGLQEGVNVAWSQPAPVISCFTSNIVQAEFQDNALAVKTDDITAFVISHCHFFYSVLSSYLTGQPIYFIHSERTPTVPTQEFLIWRNSFVSDDRSTQYITLVDFFHTFSVFKNQFKYTGLTPGGTGIYLDKDYLTYNYIDCNTFIDLNYDIYIYLGPGGELAGGTSCHGITGCYDIPYSTTISSANVFSACHGGNNIVNSSFNNVTYYVPNPPGCYSDVGPSNTIFTSATLFNDCHSPCYTCEYDFDYNASPPVGSHHRLASNSYSPEPMISVYPNPANNHFEISLPKAENPFLISIYDVNGKLVASFTSVEQQVDFNSAAFSAGMYAIAIKNDFDGINEVRKIQIIK